MGSSPSKGGGGLLFRNQDARGQGDVKLPGSRLRFSKEQVQRLNLLLMRLQQHANHGELTHRKALHCAGGGTRLQYCGAVGFYRK
jgi:hypothetical protein